MKLVYGTAMRSPESWPVDGLGLIKSHVKGMKIYFGDGNLRETAKTFLRTSYKYDSTISSGNSAINLRRNVSNLVGDYPQKLNVFFNSCFSI